MRAQALALFLGGMKMTYYLMDRKDNDSAGVVEKVDMWWRYFICKGDTVIAMLHDKTIAESMVKKLNE